MTKDLFPINAQRYSELGYGPAQVPDMSQHKALVDFAIGHGLPQLPNRETQRKLDDYSLTTEENNGY